MILQSGKYDWIWQRVSAVVIGAYMVTLMLFSLLNLQQLSQEFWYHLLYATPMRLFGIMAAVSVIIHALIGIWVVVTDYLPMLLIRVGVQCVMYSVFIGSMGTMIVLLVIG